jgi:hypothetical protein
MPVCQTAYHMLYSVTLDELMVPSLGYVHILHCIALSIKCFVMGPHTYDAYVSAATLCFLTLAVPSRDWRQCQRHILDIKQQNTEQVNKYSTSMTKQVLDEQHTTSI